MQRLSAFILLCCFTGLPSSLAGEEKPTPHEATHKQVRKLVTQRDGHAVTLNTFALDSEGNVLACVIDPNGPGLAGDSKTVTSWLQVYSPEGELLRETHLPFNATAVNQAPSGIIFVAGDGQVGKVDSKGELLTTAEAPHLGDRDALRKKAEKDAKAQMEQVTGMFKVQLERVEQMIEKLEKKDEPTERDEKRLKSLEAQQKMYADQQASMVKSYTQYFSVDAMLANARRITSLAVNSKDVFLCCRTGVGYDVWRMDHDFSSPSQVVSGLSGCCGQCDIQADEENLVLAENTKFRVSLLDRDGKRLTSFGSRAGQSEDGFGSCCNPMNVRCCSNGDILTAESSIGLIKRYNKEGDFLGTVGKARIGGGCKHVAIGFDEKRDRYYMQYEDKNQICVMWPLSEAPEFTAEELEAKAAMEGLAQKLIGDGKTTSNEWSLDGKKAVTRTHSGVFGALGQLMVAASATAGVDVTATEATGDAVSTTITIVESTQTESGDAETDQENADTEEISLQMDASARYFKFEADGKLEIQGGYSEQGDNTWAAVSQDAKTNTLIIAQLEQGIQYYNYKIKFIDDDTAKFTMMYGEQEMNSQTLKRVPLTQN